MTYPDESLLRQAAACEDLGAVHAVCQSCIAWTPEEYAALMAAYEASPKSAFNPVPVKGYSAAWQP